MENDNTLLAEAGIGWKISQTRNMVLHFGEVIEETLLEELGSQRLFKELDVLLSELSLENHQDFVENVINYNKSLFEEDCFEDSELIWVVFLTSSFVKRLSYEQKDGLLSRAKSESKKYSNPIYWIFHFLKPMIWIRN